MIFPFNAFRASFFAPAFALTIVGAASAFAQSDKSGAVIWRENFKGGLPRTGEWTRCAQPFQANISACAATAAGPGEQVYWDPKLFGGGSDPIQSNSGRGIRILAQPITQAERQLIAGAMTRQSVPPQHAAALTRAGWTSGWLQSVKSFGIGTTVRARIKPGAGSSAWSGLWMVNDPEHRRWPPEIDVAEVTNNADGSMYIRQAIHYKDDSGKLQAKGCPTTLPKRDWIDVEVSRLPNTIRFSLNGKVSCILPLPSSIVDPMQIILSQQVGGLAKPTTSGTEPFDLEVEWVEVTSN